MAQAVPSPMVSKQLKQKPWHREIKQKYGFHKLFTDIRVSSGAKPWNSAALLTELCNHIEPSHDCTGGRNHERYYTRSMGSGSTGKEYCKQHTLSYVDRAW